jgi:hypothetical protein
VVNRQIDIPTDKESEEALEQAAARFQACCHAYTLYFKLRENEKLDGEMRTRELNYAATVLQRLTTAMWQTRAITGPALINLCELLDQLCFMFTRDVSAAVNYRHVKNVLATGTEMYATVARRCKETRDKIEQI